jgi:hypothetical protein
MILFDLKCKSDHVFEAWFQDSDAYDKLVAAGAVECPVCNDTDIGKALMAPHVSSDAKKKTNTRARRSAEFVGRQMNVLAEMRQQVEDNCDYVGEKFAEEARKIHYGEADKHNIYGEASDEEAGELKEEGVEFQRIPWPRDHDA